MLTTGLIIYLLSLLAIGHLEPSLNVSTLQNELHGVCAKWYTLGVQLHIDTGTLDRIQQDGRGDVGHCLLELLIDWCQRKGNPSWNDIVKALRSKAMGEQSLADDIEGKYCLSQSAPISSLAFPERYLLISHPADEPAAEKLSKELEETFLPSIRQVRAKRNVEMEMDTQRRHHKVLGRMYKGLRGQTSEEAQEEAQVLREVLQEKKQQIDRLEQKLAEPAFKRAEEHMNMLRLKFCEPLNQYDRTPIIKKELPGAWRINNTDERKLVATVNDAHGIGHVVLLERRGRELEHEDITFRKDWAPCGIALVKGSIFVGDAAGAVRCDSTRKDLLTATTNIPKRKGFSKLLKYSMAKGEKPEEIKCQFGDPSGMAFSRDGILHVCDRATHQIWMLDVNLKPYRRCRETGYYDKDEGHFKEPAAIDFDGDGNMYVLDQGNCRVQVFSPEFQFQRMFGEEVLTGSTSCGIHVTKEFVYVTQLKKNCVSVFDKQTGAFVISFSGKGLMNPVGIAVDTEGYIYVCDDNGVWVF